MGEYESTFWQSDETEMNCREHLHAKNELENAEARRQAESGEVESFCSVADLMADLDD